MSKPVFIPLIWSFFASVCEFFYRVWVSSFSDFKKIDAIIIDDTSYVFFFFSEFISYFNTHIIKYPWWFQILSNEKLLYGLFSIIWSKPPSIILFIVAYPVMLHQKRSVHRATHHFSWYKRFDMCMNLKNKHVAVNHSLWNHWTWTTNW